MLGCGVDVRASTEAAIRGSLTEYDGLAILGANIIPRCD
jgi:hypothetical protein